MNKIEKFAESIKIHEGWHTPSLLWPKGSLSYRNNNPGNIVFGPLAKKHGAATFYKHPKTGHEFAIFPTYEQGFACLIELITNACTGKSQVYSPEMTILQYFTKYSPIRDSKGNVIPNVGYASDVAERVGVSIQTKIKDLVEAEPTNQAMNYMSQRDPRWRDLRLGFGSTTIGSHGCFLTCLSMMVNKYPDEVNEILKDNGGFYKDLIISEAAAKALGLKYYGREYLIDNEPGWYPSIKEVDMSPRSGKQQHFVLRIFDNGRKYIIDPWDGQKKKIGFYPFVSYRLFK